MKILATLIASFALTASAIEFGDISPTYQLYSEADPFAIGVSTAAYTASTNLQTRVSALESDITGKVPTSRTVAVNGVVGSLGTNVSFTVSGGVTGPYVRTFNGLSNDVTFAEADTLATVAARGGFAGSEELSVFSVFTTGTLGYSVLSGDGFQAHRDEPYLDVMIGAFGGFYLNFLNNTHEWLIQDGFFRYAADASLTNTYWSFARPSGYYTVAATSDLDSKLDRSGGTATNLAVVGAMTLNGTNVATWMSFCNLRATNATQTVVSNGTITNYTTVAECPGFISNAAAGIMTNLVAGYFDVGIAATMIDGNGTRTLQVRTNDVPAGIYISEYSGDRAASTSGILYLPANTKITAHHDGTGSVKYHSLKAVQLR